MHALKEIAFIKEIIADKIARGDSANTLIVVMNLELFVFENQIQKQQYILPSTYQSPVFLNSHHIHIHNVQIDRASNQVTTLDLNEICMQSNDEPHFLEDRFCTRMVWTANGNKFMASLRTFQPRNGDTQVKKLLNKLVAVSLNEKSCYSLDEHSYQTFDCTTAGKHYLASYAEGLKVWRNFKPVLHHLTFNKDLAMDHLCFVNEDALLYMIDALGSVFIIDTANWQQSGHFKLDKYSSGIRVSIAGNGKFIATGDNEGNCIIYQKGNNGFSKIVDENLAGIITAIDVSEKSLIAGLNGTKKSGTFTYAMPD